MNNTFGKEKRLKSRKAIEKIFSEGKSIYKFPVRAVYFCEQEVENGFKIGVSVPKKRFKRATDRNLLKRMMRESFRKNQMNLIPNGKLNIMFIYSANEVLHYAEIEKSIMDLIDSLNSFSNENISNK